MSVLKYAQIPLLQLHELTFLSLLERDSIETILDYFLELVPIKSGFILSLPHRGLP